ncbi:MAG: hypothetical protein ACU836_01245 [Gammaproteobacteria bacterium]
MNTLLKTATFSTLLIFSAAGSAQQAHHQASDSGKSASMQHNMSGMDHAKMSDHMNEMQTHMLMMHDLSNQILAEKDPKQQQSLKDQQLELMKAHHKQMMSSHHGKSDMPNMDPAKMAENMKQKQEHMLMMHELSNKILAEKDPKKQQTLKNQQLELMKAHHKHMMSMHHGKEMEHQSMK